MKTHVTLPGVSRGMGSQPSPAHRGRRPPPARAVRSRGKISDAQHLRAVSTAAAGTPQIHARELVDVAPHDDVRVQVQDARSVGQDVRQVERREVERRQQLLALHARRVAEHLQRAHGRPELELVVQPAADAHAEVERRPLASQMVLHEPLEVAGRRRAHEGHDVLAPAPRSPPCC